MEENPLITKIKNNKKVIAEIVEKYPCASSGEKSVYDQQIKNCMDNIAKVMKDSANEGKLLDHKLFLMKPYEEFMFELKKKECYWPANSEMGSFGGFMIAVIILLAAWLIIMG